MKETTKKAFEMMKEEFGNRLFDVDEVKGISESTFFRYRKEFGIEKVIEKEDEWTIEEIVEKLNSCADSDCYGTWWQFIVEDGKIYNLIEGYRFKD